jgi:hypothetical protein
VIGFTDPAPEDKEFLLKEQTEGINKFWTINEVLVMRGLDPGGDVLYQPSTNVPNYLRSLSNRRSRWMSTKIRLSRE